MTLDPDPDVQRVDQPSLPVTPPPVTPIEPDPADLLPPLPQRPPGRFRRRAVLGGGIALVVGGAAAGLAAVTGAGPFAPRGEAAQSLAAGVLRPGRYHRLRRPAGHGR